MIFHIYFHYTPYYKVLFYLLNRVKIRVIEVSQEPQDSRSQHFPEKEDEGCEVEDVNHAHQPVDKHGRTRCQAETRLSIFQAGIEHVLFDRKQIITKCTGIYPIRK